MSIAENIAEKLQQIADNMQRVYDAGKAEGGDTTDAYNRGVAYGKVIQNDEFWEKFTTNLNAAAAPTERRDYSSAFIKWYPSNFYPTKNLKPNTLYMAFSSFNEYATPFDLRQRLIDCGVTLDTELVTNVQAAFQYSYISVLPTLDLRKCTNFIGMLNNSKVETVEKIILKDDGSQTMQIGTFGTSTLKNITFEGKIGTNVTFQYSPLLTTGAEGEKTNSVQSIIDALLNLIENGKATQTITFHPDVKAKLTAEQIANITQTKGWTLA